MATKPLPARPFDLLVFIFFLSHIPITIFIDSQGVLPKHWFSDGPVQLMQWYLGKFGDPLVRPS